LLSEKELISKYSVKDLLMHLSEIRKVKINNSWKMVEITKKTHVLLRKLEIPIRGLYQKSILLEHCSNTMYFIR